MCLKKGIHSKCSKRGRMLDTLCEYCKVNFYSKNDNEASDVKKIKLDKTGLYMASWSYNNHRKA